MKRISSKLLIGGLLPTFFGFFMLTFDRQAYAFTPAAIPDRQNQENSSIDDIYASEYSPVANILSIDLQNNDSLLTIKTDRPFTYTKSWNNSLNVYQITINSAQLAPVIKSLQTHPHSLVEWIRVQQQDPQTVVIFLQPAPQVQITELITSSPDLLKLQLRSVSPNTITTPLPQNYDQKTIVVIDPGHGGRDSGAVGINGLREKDVVLDIGKQVSTLLEQNGIKVIMTRSSDREVELEPRVQLAERVNANLFVSIHANAINMTRPDISGLETYYYHNGLGLAKTIHNSILQKIGLPDRRVRQANFYVIKFTSMPAVLVEVGFVTGKDDASKLANPAYRSQMAQAIAQGILQYLHQGG